ncbi:MAG: hypothetical protein ABFD16_16480, partial [Thermoguttaceae bacterium]
GLLWDHVFRSRPRKGTAREGVFQSGQEAASAESLRPLPSLGKGVGLVRLDRRPNSGRPMLGIGKNGWGCRRI